MAVNDENNFSIWITDKLELFQKNMFYSINESLGGNTFKDIPKDAKGFMMEMHFENLVNGEKGKMIVSHRVAGKYRAGVCGFGFEPRHCLACGW